MNPRLIFPIDEKSKQVNASCDQHNPVSPLPIEQMNGRVR